MPAIAATYVALAMLLGGGGSSAPLSEMLLELVAAGAAAAWMVAAHREGQPAMPADRLIWAIAAMAVALPAVQLLPLPPAIWQALPGRENEIAALGLVGGESQWMPWSMTPSRTFAALLAILPAVLAMAMVASLDLEGRRLVLGAVVIIALASLVLGALQLSAGNTAAWRPYGPENNGYLNGFQANRNAETDILQFGIVALAVVLAAMRRAIGESMTAAGVVAGGLLLSLGCLTTGSRAGVALLPVAIIAAGAIWIGRRPGKRVIVAAAAVAFAAAVGGLMLYMWNSRVANVVSRFVFSHDPRQNVWADTYFAIARHWPFGTGVGSFKPIFIAAERLEFVDPFYPTAAHNDFLELALEGGLFGLALLAAIGGLIAWLIAKALKAASVERRNQVFFAVAALIIIASHSVVDYPLRSMAIACIAGVAVGLLSALPTGDAKGELPA